MENDLNYPVFETKWNEASDFTLTHLTSAGLIEAHLVFQQYSTYTYTDNQTTGTLLFDFRQKAYSSFPQGLNTHTHTHTSVSSSLSLCSSQAKSLLAEVREGDLGWTSGWSNEEVEYMWNNHDFHNSTSVSGWSTYSWIRSHYSFFTVDAVWKIFELFES